MVTTEILTEATFEDQFLTYFGRYIDHIPITKTTSNITGEETLTDGVTAKLTCYFIKTNQIVDYEKNGLTIRGDAILLSKCSDSVERDDKILADGQTYRVQERYNVPGVFDKDADNVQFAYTVCSLFKLS